VAHHFDFQHDAKVSMFEAIIRIVGGLLAAYDLSEDELFLTKAQELASKMLTNFQHNGSGDATILP
jgi:mannosyl-oligosaccharide alpha-1,2-mannosidase